MEAGEVRIGLPGKLLRGALDGGIDVGVGDWVGVADGLIRSVLPRRSAIVRNAAGLTTTAQTLAANVDVAFVLSSLGPDLEPRRIERYLVADLGERCDSEIVLTRADRLEDPWELVAEVEEVALGVPVHTFRPSTARAVMRCARGSRRAIRRCCSARRASASRRLSTDGSARTSWRRARPARTTTRAGTRRPSASCSCCRAAGSSSTRPASASSSSGTSARRTRRDVLRRRGARCGVPLRRLLARARARLRGARGGRVRRAAADRLQSWRKLQRELRAMAIRHDVLLRKKEARKWHLATREGAARAKAKRR